MDAAALAGLNPFGIFDVEAARLDHFFGGLDAAGWSRPSRCAGWSVQDVLAHLAGEELYNHACRNENLDGFRAMVRAAGITGGFNDFNPWCVRQRRDLPAAEVLADGGGQRGDPAPDGDAGPGRAAGDRDGPYPVGLQAMHYSSEYATHADDIGAPVAPGEEPGRTAWRVSFGRYALDEQNSPAKILPGRSTMTVQLGDVTAELTPEDFVEATVGRLPDGYPLDPALRDALRCLA